MPGILSQRSEKLLNKIFSTKKRGSEEEKPRPEVQDIFKLLQTRRNKIKKVNRL